MESLFSESFIDMAIRLVLNIAVTFSLVRFLYYPKSRHRNFYFSFMLISVAIFFLVYFMIFSLVGMKGKAGVGIGIGLFGIFSIMRYRTDAMPVREMTYLFVIIALSVVNAIAGKSHFAELIATNAFVILATIILEKSIKVHPSKLIQYDRIELIKPERHEELLADLKERTGLDITHLEIGSIDFLKDTAILKVYYNSENGAINSVDHRRKLGRSTF